MSSLSDRMKKASKSEYAQVLSESDKFAIADWISTGNFALNTLISGNPNRGFPSGRILQLAGPHSTGKTFINLEIVRAAQQQGYFIVYYDTEFAQDKESLEDRGIDIERLLYVPVDTVENLSTSMLNVIDQVADGEKVLIVVDSIGNLSTTKELQDMTDANDKRDMTRAQKLKALFRTVTLKCGLKNIPLIIVNHVYASVGSYFPSNTVGGGSGSLYASSTIIELSKSQDKEGTDIVGAMITCKSLKNRFAKEKKKVQINIKFDAGMDPYSGLLDLAEASGVLPKSSTGRYEWDDKKLTRKAASSPEVLSAILKDPTFLRYLEVEFKYSSGVEDLIEGNGEEQDISAVEAIGKIEEA